MTAQELRDIENNQDIKFCYIRKGAYYRPGACVYTDFRVLAGVFEKSDAIKQATSCRDLLLVPVNVIEHNKMILGEIDKLYGGLIP